MRILKKIIRILKLFLMFLFLGSSSNDNYYRNVQLLFYLSFFFNKDKKYKVMLYIEIVQIRFRNFIKDFMLKKRI